MNNEKEISEIETEEIILLCQLGGAFDFLNDEAEDIYEDSDLKIIYI